MYLPSIRFFLNPRYIMEQRMAASKCPLSDETAQRDDVTMAEAMRRLGSDSKGFETRFVRCTRCGLRYRYGCGHLDSAFCHHVYQTVLAYKAGLFPVTFPAQRGLERLGIHYEMRYTRGALTGGEPVFRNMSRIERRIWIPNEIAYTIWHADDFNDFRLAVSTRTYRSLDELHPDHFWAPDVVAYFNAWKTPDEEVPIHLRWPPLREEAA